MVKVNANFEFDASESEDLLAILENLSRDLNNIQDRQDRLTEHGVAINKFEFKDGEIVIQLQSASK